MACCTDKKSVSELCEKCYTEMMIGGAATQYTGDIMVTDWTGSMPAAPKCECGADAVQGPGHSSWCPKFSQTSK